MFKPNREFQAGFNTEDSRRQRQSDSLSLRRKAREIKLQNKRKKLTKTNQPKSTAAGATNQDQNGGELPTMHPNNEETRKKMLSDLPRYVEGCYTAHSAAHLECTTKIRELLSFATNVPIEQVMASGVVPRMIDFLSFREAPKLQLEALWVLTNMASSDNPQYTAQIVTSGGIPPIIAVLTFDCTSYSLQEQALWALGNIAGESAEMRDLMVSEDTCLSSLVAVSRQRFSAHNGKGSEEEFVSMLRTLSWSVSNFCRHYHLERAHCRQLVECLYHLLLQREQQPEDESECWRALESDAEIQTNIGWSFSYLTNDCMNAHWDDILEMMMKHSITSKLIAFLDSAQLSTCTSNLRAIGNVLTGHDKFTANCVESGVLPKLYAVLERFHAESVNHAKLKEVLWALSNITACEEPKAISAVVEHRSFAVLMAILRDSRTQIAAEALWTVSNATSCNDAQIIRFLLSKGVVEAICTFWKKLESANHRTSLNEKLLRISFECVENVLGMDDAASGRARDDFEEHGGLDFLEALQSDERISQDIYEHTVRLVKRFWPEEENDGGDGQQHSLEQQLNAPIHCTDDGHGNQFGFGLHSNSAMATKHSNNEQPQTSYSAFDF